MSISEKAIINAHENASSSWKEHLQKIVEALKEDGHTFSDEADVVFTWKYPDMDEVFTLIISENDPFPEENGDVENVWDQDENYTGQLH